MRNVFVVMIQKDCHEPEIHLYDDEEAAVLKAKDEASAWCEQGFIHERETDRHTFLSKDDDDSFSVTVVERYVN